MTMDGQRVEEVGTTAVEEDGTNVLLGVGTMLGE
jgi:hypothetical protein